MEDDESSAGRVMAEIEEKMLGAYGRCAEGLGTVMGWIPWKEVGDTVEVARW
jgi:hypothetical protein